MSWIVPVGEWAGETCHILGGGPSLALVDLSALGGRIIAINNAYIGAPKADVLYFSDRRWYEWNRDDLHRYEGPLMVTRSVLKNPSHDVKRMGRNLKAALSRDPREVSGLCGGANALNLAFLFGAKRVFLHGFDMRQGNWHDLHRTVTAPFHYKERFMPYFERMAPELEREGVEVINATPNSAMTCFRMGDILTPA